MFFVIDRPRLQRIIAIVRDDRTRRMQGREGPFLRMEARDGQLKLAGKQIKATFPATVYEPGVLFLRITYFRKALRALAGEKMLSIQVTPTAVVMDNITLPLDANEMLLYADPAKAPEQCPLEGPESKWPDETSKCTDPLLPLFDHLDEQGQADRASQNGS